MGLSTVASHWQCLAEQAVRQRQTLADYVAQLVHLEVTARRERRIEDARFPMLKTLDAFSFEAEADLDRAAVLQTTGGSFRLAAAKQNLHAADSVWTASQTASRF